MMSANENIRMLYVYRGWNSGTNQAVLQAWRKGLPELNIQEHDVCPLSEKTFRTRMSALPHALHRGGFGIFARKTGNFTDSVKRSRWYRSRVEKKMCQLGEEVGHDFSLSTCTLVPPANPRRPYFIYTDLTILANLYYPRGEEHVELWQDYLSYEKEILQAATVVFTMSEHVSRSLTEHYGLSRNKICRVNGGCNTPPVDNPDPQRYARQRILFVGVDWERKGGPELLQAFRKVRRHYPEATLTIVGCNPHLPDEPGVSVEGFVTQEAVPRYLQESTVFCMPSNREPFGIAYLEAMQAGLPVVATNRGATPDFVIEGQTGFKVEPGNVDQLAEYLEEIVGNPGLARQMGSNGMSLVKSNYTWEHTQRQMWQVIQPYLQ